MHTATFHFNIIYFVPGGTYIQLELRLWNWRHNKYYLPTETKLMFIQTWLMDPHIHLEQHALFDWHTWNSNCLGTKLICMLVHEHSGIFLICNLANLSSHSGSVMAWRQLGMIYSLACVHREQVARVCNDCFKNLVSNNSCALAKSCHISTFAGVTPKVTPMRLVFYYHRSRQNLLNQTAIRNGFHCEELNFRMNVFFLYLNQNGNEEWWPSIACLNPLKRAQFVVL